MPILSAFVATCNIIPVDDVGEGFQVIWTAILVLQIVGVLPDIAYQKRSHDPLGQILMLLGCKDAQVITEVVLNNLFMRMCDVVRESS